MAAQEEAQLHNSAARSDDHLEETVASQQPKQAPVLSRQGRAPNDQSKGLRHYLLPDTNVFLHQVRPTFTVRQCVFCVNRICWKRWMSWKRQNSAETLLSSRRSSRKLDTAPCRYSIASKPCLMMILGGSVFFQTRPDRQCYPSCLQITSTLT